jgi:diguanylate cyclase (GGDEF)-like protein
MIDVDHFKDYNDGYGHVAGDACLQQVSALLAYLLAGTSARLARYGGEEFAVILPAADGPTSAAIAERIRGAVHARGFEHRHTPGGQLTISVGVACADAGDRDAESLVRDADNALYAAKHGGRNRVRLASVEAHAHQKWGLSGVAL